MSMSSQESSRQELIVNFGPQHPSTHGVLRLILTLAGETVTHVEPVLGYLHRGFEKLGEYKLYQSGLPLTDRMDYLAAMSNNLAYSRAVEALCRIEVPRRAQYIRVLMVELNRIASHLVGIGAFIQDIGNPTPFVYGFRDREGIVALFEEVSGARLTYSYIRPGGVLFDIPKGFPQRVEAFLTNMERTLPEYHALITENAIFRMRTKGIGSIDAQTARSYGLSGPNARGSGIPQDLRKTAPYECYSDLNFAVKTKSAGDVFSRYLVRTEEIVESISLCRQVIQNMPNGEVQTRLPAILRPPKGEVYTAVESPRGELGIYMVSDGGIRPYRYKVNAPSFLAVGALSAMMKGCKIADAVAILGSIDIVLGEVDR